MARGRKFEITSKEFTLALVLAAMGFAFTTKPVILFLNGLNPVGGLIAYYVILYSALYILSRVGLVVAGIRIDTSLKALGALMITIAFLITVNWSSCYVNEVSGGTCAGVSNLFVASEDGAAYYIWNDVLGVSNHEHARLLTYVLTPFILAITGAAFVTGKLKLGG